MSRAAFAGVVLIFGLPGLPMVGAAPAVRVAVDATRCCLLLDGKPFFPLGLMAIPTDQMADCARVGFNVTLRHGGGGGFGSRMKEARATGPAGVGALVRPYLDAAHAAGLMAIEWPLVFAAEDLSYAHPDFAGRFEQAMQGPVPEVVAAIKSHPALLAYYGPDEPFGPYCAQAAEYTRRLGELDPLHPVYTVFPMAVTARPDIRGVWGADFYPRSRQTPLGHVYEWVAASARLAHAQGRPYWHVPVASYWAQIGCYGPLTANEHQAQAYLAVIGGANGLLWWVWPVHDPAAWLALKKVAVELRALSPVLCEPPVETAVMVTPEDRRGMVYVRAIRHGRDTVLICCNASETPVEVVIQTPVSSRGSAEVLFEARKLPWVSGALRDSFPALGRHVYRLPGQWAATSPLRLSLTAPQDAARIVEPERVKPTGINLVPNPGFEQDGGWRFETSEGNSSEQAAGRYDSGAARSGQRSLCLQANGLKGAAQWLTDWFDLRPDTRYLFSGWARAETAGPRNLSFLRLQLEGPGAPPWVELHIPQFSPWRQHWETFATGPGQVRARVWCRYHEETESEERAGHGRAWFDDVFLGVAGEANPNLLWNSGFEGEEMAPGWPRGWWPNATVADPGASDPEEGTWTIDTQAPFEGRRCFRIQKRNPLFAPLPPVWLMGGAGRVPGVFQFLPTGTSAPAGQPVYLAVALRADHDGAYATLTVPGWMPDRTIKVGREWQRHVLPLTLTADATALCAGVSLFTPGTLWVDAVQLGLGSDPGSYVPGPDL